MLWLLPAAIGETYLTIRDFFLRVEKNELLPELEFAYLIISGIE